MPRRRAPAKEESSAPRIGPALAGAPYTPLPSRSCQEKQQLQTAGRGASPPPRSGLETEPPPFLCPCLRPASIDRPDTSPPAHPSEAAHHIQDISFQSP